jgi:hypothetical protein
MLAATTRSLSASDIERIVAAPGRIARRDRRWPVVWALSLSSCSRMRWA